MRLHRLAMAAALVAVVAACVVGAPGGAHGIKPCGKGHGCKDDKAVCCQSGEGYCCPHGFVCSADGDATCFRDHSLAALHRDLGRLEADAVEAHAAKGDLSPAQEGEERRIVAGEAAKAVDNVRKERVKDLEARLHRLGKLEKVAEKDATYLRGVKKGLEHVKRHVKAMHSMPPKHASKLAKRKYAQQLKAEIDAHKRATKLLSTAYVAHQKGVLALLGHKLHTKASKTVRHGAINHKGKGVAKGKGEAKGKGKGEAKGKGKGEAKGKGKGEAKGKGKGGAGEHAGKSHLGKEADGALPERRVDEHPMDHTHRTVPAPKAAAELKVADPKPSPDAPVAPVQLQELTKERVKADAAEFIRHRLNVKEGHEATTPAKERQYANLIIAETAQLEKQEAEKKAAAEADAAGGAGAASSSGSSGGSSSGSAVADLTPEQVRDAVAKSSLAAPHGSAGDAGKDVMEVASDSSGEPVVALASGHT